MKKAKESRATRGRPRSEAAQQAVQEATIQLLEESGYSALTIEAIALRSGVGRPTIYRWWQNKGELLSEIYLARMESDPLLAVADLGSLRLDLQVFLKGLIHHLSGTDGQLLRAILLESQLVEDFRSGFRQLMARRQKPLEALFVRALRRGEIDRIPSVAIYDSLYGPLFYRLQAQHAPLDASFGEELAEMINFYLRS